MSELTFMAADWPAPEWIIAGTTLRGGAADGDPRGAFNFGVQVGDQPDRVAANRRLLRQSLALPGEPAWLRQVHGTVVVDADATCEEPEADAAVGRDPATVCAVLTADCLPVLFCRRDGAAFAAAHAGWRGLAAGVLENTLSALDSAPGDLLAWLGPAISQRAFEVGQEVMAAFVAADAGAACAFEVNARGRWQADLYALARRRLQAAGLRQIYGGDRCTYRESADFYSYRRDARCGRMASLIFRRDTKAGE